jgi:cytochrome c-type biogenesis protein CcmH/NrfF
MHHRKLRCWCAEQDHRRITHKPAVDLPKQIRQKLQQGQSEQQILDFMVQRYGFVLTVRR